MKAKITNSLNQNAMPTWRFGTLMALLFVLVLNTTTFAQNGQYVLGPDSPLPIEHTNNSENGITPFACSKIDSRNQYLYYGEEFPMTQPAGWITTLAFNVTGLAWTFSGDTKMYNVTIGLTSTNKTDLNGTIESTTTYLFLPELVISATGWVSFDLTTSGTYPNGFWWVGSSSSYKNIIVEICQHSPVKEGSEPSNNYEVQTSTYDNYVNNNYFSEYNSTDYLIDATPGCSMTATSPGTETYYDANFTRPDVRFTFSCTGSPVKGTPAPKTTLKKCIGNMNTLEVPDGDFHSGVDYQWQSSTDGVNFIDISGATSQTYDAEKVAVDMWYRRYNYCTGAGLANFSLPYFIPQKTWYGGPSWTTSTHLPSSEPTSSESAVFEGDYTSGGNLNFCSMVVKSGNVSISSGNSVLLSGTLALGFVKVNGGNLTFQNTASLNQLSTNSTMNSGNVTFKRNSQPLLRYDYTYWSSPVIDQVLGTFSPGTLSDKFYSWNHTGQVWNLEATSNKMAKGKGYIIRAPQTYNISGAKQVFEGNFIGVPVNGNFSTPIAGDGTGTKWNLLGNPYPSSLDLNAFYTTNSSKINGTFYFWMHNTAPSSAIIIPGAIYNYDVNDYGSYNLTGSFPYTAVSNPASTGGPTPGRYLASGQSFMVTGKINNSVVFFNSHRNNSSANNGNFYKQSEKSTDNDEDEVEKSRIWLEFLNENGGFKQTLVGYIEGASSDFDDAYDGDSMGGDGVDLFSILPEHQLCIQGRSLPFLDDDKVLLGFKAKVAGNCSIAAVHFDGLFESQNIYLEDTYLNVIHDLKISKYDFVTTEGAFLDRFVLRYTENALNLDKISINTNNILAFNQSGNLVVNAGIINIQSVKVYDLSGRLVLQKNDCQSPNVVFEKPNWNAQLMLVKVITEDNVEVTRKVLF